MKSSRAVILSVLATPLVLGACLLFGASGFGLPQSDNILRLRAYRILAGFIVGAGLSCSGVIFQALLRNPLAEPYLLGVSSGAGLGAALSIIAGVGVSALGVSGLPLFAFIGAIITLFAVYRLAHVNGQSSMYSLILSGVIVSAMCSAVLMYLVSTAQGPELRSITWWMLGNLQASSRSVLHVATAIMGVTIALTLFLARDLNALTLGDEMAHHVGVDVKRTVPIGLTLATLLAATAVSVSGLIGFVGLIVPHSVRSMTGADHRRLMPCAALVGGMFLCVCDAVARSLAVGGIPVGVITALLGGPFFLTLLRKRRQHGWAA